MEAHQAPPSLGFSRQEHWSGLPFPSPVHESEKWKWSRSVVSDSSRPMDCSLPGSSIHEISQARVLEWGAIAFSISWSLPKFMSIALVTPSNHLILFVTQVKREKRLSFCRTSWTWASPISLGLRTLTCSPAGPDLVEIPGAALLSEMWPDGLSNQVFGTNTLVSCGCAKGCRMEW